MCSTPFTSSLYCCYLCFSLLHVIFLSLLELSSSLCLLMRTGLPGLCAASSLVAGNHNCSKTQPRTSVFIISFIRFKSPMQWPHQWIRHHHCKAKHGTWSIVGQGSMNACRVKDWRLVSECLHLEFCVYSQDEGRVSQVVTSW